MNVYDQLRELYHKTRMTHNIAVPADLIHSIVYGQRLDLEEAKKVMEKNGYEWFRA